MFEVIEVDGVFHRRLKSGSWQECDVSAIENYSLNPLGYEDMYVEVSYSAFWLFLSEGGKKFPVFDFQTQELLSPEKFPGWKVILPENIRRRNEKQGFRFF